MTVLGVRTVLRASIAAVCAFCASPAFAQSSRVDVPAQAAKSGIPELARELGIQILVSERAARGKKTGEVKGTMGPREALNRLLARTGLQAVQIDQHTFAIIADSDPAAAPTSRPGQSRRRTDSPQAQIDPPNPPIIVTGFRSSIREALARKRRETGSVDTILAEDVGKFPDSNLAEAMQRLPGVALSRGDGGGGRNITVRGLAAQFTRVRINGMEAVSQTGGSDAYGGSNSGRAFDFNVFPSEIFSSLSARFRCARPPPPMSKRGRLARLWI